MFSTIVNNSKKVIKIVFPNGVSSFIDEKQVLGDSFGSLVDGMLG